ncbi:retrotransposon protein [Cucumis melo var. makuwa]|nr:retrotransposon protein [Cucumis melo var. makuwa]
MLGERMVSCSLMTTIIESRIKLLKKTFQAIAEMRGPVAKRLLNKYDALSHVFGKDRATGACAETFADIDSNVQTDNDSVPAEDGINMEFPAMCRPRMNMSPKDMMSGRSSQSSDARMVSSRQKRKRFMQQLETYDLIRKCMEVATDQLRTIVEWPEKAMSREDVMPVQVIELSESIPNLTIAEKSKCIMIVNQKVSLKRSFIKMFDSMKTAYCKVPPW